MYFTLFQSTKDLFRVARKHVVMRRCAILALCCSFLIVSEIKLFAQEVQPLETRNSELSSLFPANFLAPDTTRTEYAGLFVHYIVGGFSTRLADYPDTWAASYTPLRSSLRTISFGLNSDSPFRLPFLTKRQNNAWFQGLRFGMQIEAQLSDISIVESSDSVRLSNGSVLRGEFQHSAFANLRSLALTPSLRYSFASGLTASIGARLGVVNSSNIRMVDTVLALRSSGTTPLAGNLLRPIIDDARISGLRAEEFSIVAGIGYNIRLDKLLQIRPEVLANIPIKSPNDSSGWRNTAPSLRFGVSVMFNTEKVVPVPDTSYVRDTAIVLLAHNQQPLLRLVSRRVEVRPAEYPEEPPSVKIEESYRREIPKPKPILTASIDAEFALLPPRKNSRDSLTRKAPLGNVQFRRTLSLNAEKTAIRFTPICANATNASVYADVLQEYFSVPPLRLQRLESSTNTILADTTLLVSALPYIRFTPRVVSEISLKGTELCIVRERPHGRSSMESPQEARRLRLATFTDTSANAREQQRDNGGEAHILWSPTRQPDVFLAPNERLFYTFRVFDEEGAEAAIDSGSITLRTEPSTGNLGVKRSIEVYAFEKDVHLADFMRSLIAINVHNAERVCIVPPQGMTELPGNDSTKNDANEMRLRVQLLERSLPNAEQQTLSIFSQLPSFNASNGQAFEGNALQSPTHLPSALSEREQRLQSTLAQMLLVFVERRL
ncbi:MAG: hypothetical protein EAZ92_12605 [Candidatus Kapaibacterium sp.]|nr:MAG: hypothetical protein EAZ92_12605 [Candidatus Kapabacteria bacterium]